MVDINDFLCNKIEMTDKILKEEKKNIFLVVTNYFIILEKSEFHKPFYENLKFFLSEN